MMILITGATGFVRKYCVKALSDSCQIIQLKRKGKEDDSSLIMDLKDIESMKKLKSVKIDILVHVASAVPPLNHSFFDNNVIGTYNLLKSINEKALKNEDLVIQTKNYKQNFIHVKDVVECGWVGGEKELAYNILEGDWIDTGTFESYLYVNEMMTE